MYFVITSVKFVRLALTMALRSVISSRVPMVVILGATGTGKTKLSVELAQKLGTEIISADSMQIYKGLDIVTAKASKQERAAAPHHLLDILEPHQMFTVVDFRARALKIIENLTEQGKIPIIVGGTNYYIESIVYKILVEDTDDANVLLWDRSRRKRDHDNSLEEPCTDYVDGGEGSCSQRTKEEETNESVEIDKTQVKKDYDNEAEFTNEQIHQNLKAIDPAMAARLHPNNRRKVLRSIEVWLKTGRRHSDILKEQKDSEGQLRRPGATVVLWLKCEQAQEDTFVPDEAQVQLPEQPKVDSVHDERLNRRVDSMLEEGLIQELLDFHEIHNKKRIQDGKPPDYTKGVFQTLGFKEFHDYLMLPHAQRESGEGVKLLQQSIENMKIGTRRYARRQNKMVKGRFLEHPTREVPPIYELDTTDLASWNSEVRDKAINIIEHFLNGTPCAYQPVEITIDEQKRGIDGNSRNFCTVCNRLILGDRTYAIHMNSYRHMKVLKKKNRLEKQAEAEATK